MKESANIKKIYWISFFRDFHLFTAILIPFFTLWGEISFSQIMLLQAIFTFSVFALEVPTGVIADKIGRRKSIVIACLFSIIAPIVYSSFANFWVFAIAEILWATSRAFISGADSAMIYDSLKSTKETTLSKKIFGKARSFGMAGILVAAPIGGLIAQLMSERITMTLTVFPMIIATIISLTLKEPNKKFSKKGENSLKIFKSGMKKLKDNKPLRVLSIDYIIVGIFSFFILWAYQLVLQKNNVPVLWFGVIHSSMIVLQILLLNKISFFEKIFGGKRKYLGITAIIVGFSFILMAFVQNIFVIIGLILTIAMFGLTRKVIHQSYLNKFIDSHNRATVLSIISMGYSLGMAIMNVFLGFITEWNMDIGLIIVGSMIIIFSIISRIEEEYLID